MKQDYKVTFCDGFTGAEMNNFLYMKQGMKQKRLKKES